jgi:hypothetical protein
MVNNKKSPKKTSPQRVAVPVTTSLDPCNFNTVRKAKHRYVLTGDTGTVTRASLLSMKIAKVDASATSALKPLLTAVKLNRVVIWTPPSDQITDPPNFSWETENSNGINTKIRVASTQMSKTILTPNGRALLWSNANSSALTLGETLFTLKNENTNIDLFIDVYFDYVETAGLTTNITCTGGSTLSQGVTYPALDSHAAGLLTKGTWNMNPVVDDSQAFDKTTPTTFTRVL